jgi:catechol 2,3-dioxygenase
MTSSATRENSFTTAPPGYRLPAALRLGPVRLAVADLGRSLDYYERVIGLRTIERTPSRALLGAQADDAPLVELIARPGASPVPRRGRLGLFHYAILLPDRSALGRFLAHLGELGEYAGMSDHRVSEAIYLSDPDGLGIEVYADRPRESWRIERGMLAMTTEPLDTQSLIQAARGEPWTGAPPGTRIGHVHLHVGDLASAEAFYHEGLGLDKVTLRYPGALFMSAGGYHHHLGTNTWAAGAAVPDDGDARLLEWTIQLPEQADVEAAARSLVSRGYAVDREGEDVLSADPWGTRVRVVGR